MIIGKVIDRMRVASGTSTFSNVMKSWSLKDESVIGEDARVGGELKGVSKGTSTIIWDHRWQTYNGTKNEEDLGTLESDWKRGGL